jgi:hypothetical protein
MENLIASAALSILVIGLIAVIVGLIEFTRCFENSSQERSKSATPPSA